MMKPAGQSKMMIIIIGWDLEGSRRWWSYDDDDHHMMAMMIIWWDRQGSSFPRVAAFSSATERPGHEMEVAPPGPPGPQGPWGPSERPGHDHKADYDGNGDDHGNGRSGETCENDEMLQTQEKITFACTQSLWPDVHTYLDILEAEEDFHSWKRSVCSGGKWWKQVQQRSDMQWLIPGWAWTSRPTWTPATECLLQRRLIM